MIPRKFTVELRRIFNTQSLPAGAALRLRMPLPLTSDLLGDLEVHPHAVVPGAHVAVSRGRHEVRTQASDSGEVGATEQNPRQRGAGSSSGCSARSTRQAQTGSSHTVENRSRNLCWAGGLSQMTTSQVTCACGALYERTEFHSAPREADSFVCPSCGHTLETFSGVEAPRYRLISAPLRKPEKPSD
jgi:hypothetical protein